ncbi:MAG: hypothetical protein AB7T06_03445 [Kofleriaceae bacterium]
MLVTLIIIGALLAGAGVLLSVQMASNRSSDLTRSGMSALYCAEAGLAAARQVVASHYMDWKASLCTTPTCTEPTWMADGIDALTSPKDHDLDGDGAADFTVWLRDNYDEMSANDFAVDSDLQVFIVSKCIKYTDTPKQVEELILFEGGIECYPWQLGGCSGGGQ